MYPYSMPPMNPVPHAHDSYKKYWTAIKDDPKLREQAEDEDERLKYFLPPLRDEGKKSKAYPVVLSKDAILTAKGVLPRNPKRDDHWLPWKDNCEWNKCKCKCMYN